MKTLTTAPNGHLGDTSTRLRRLAAAGALVPLLALAACSGEDAVTANPTGAAEATTAAPSTTTATETATPTTSETTPKPTSTAIKATIKDPVLGHTITAVRVARNLPWPAGNPVGSDNFEIVGVSLTVQAGTRYSASVDPAMFALKAAPSTVFVQPTTEFGERYQITALGSAKRGEREKGWLFFKVDKGSTETLTLRYNRPAYTVSTTDKDIPKKAFDVKLTG